MDTGIIVAVVTGALTITGASITYFQTKHKDREQERRQLKTESYKDLLIALARAQQRSIQNPTPKQLDDMFADLKTFFELCDTVNAVASESVVKALDDYIKTSNNAIMTAGTSTSQQEIETAFNGQIYKYSELMYAIRDELGAANDVLKKENFIFIPWTADPNILSAGNPIKEN